MDGGSVFALDAPEFALELAAELDDEFADITGSATFDATDCVTGDATFDVVVAITGALGLAPFAVLAMFAETDGGLLWAATLIAVHVHRPATQAK